MSRIGLGAVRLGLLAVSPLTPVHLLTATFVACTRTESPHTEIPDTVSTDKMSDVAAASQVPVLSAVVTDSRTVDATIDSIATAVSCSPPTEREWYEPDPDQQLFLESGLQWGMTEADLARRLGPPLRIVVDTTQNIHTGGMDQLRQVEYAGLTFFIYRVLELQRDIIYQVDADSDQYSFAFGFRVGSPWQEILDCLGDASVVDGSTARYSVGETDERITFWIAQGVVQRIRWEFYID